MILDEIFGTFSKTCVCSPIGYLSYYLGVVFFSNKRTSLWTSRPLENGLKFHTVTHNMNDHTIPDSISLTTIFFLFVSVIGSAEATINIPQLSKRYHCLTDAIKRHLRKHVIPRHSLRSIDCTIGPIMNTWAIPDMYLQTTRFVLVTSLNRR